MLFVGFNKIKFVDIVISGQIIMWFFVAIAILAFAIFLFNLIFIRPGSRFRTKKENDPKIIEKQKQFDQQKEDVENEISLILRVEEERLKVKEN